MLNTYPCNPFPISSEQLHKGDNEDLQAQINAIKDGSVIDSFGDVETALDTKADNDVIAPEFDAEAGTYEIGDLVMYEGKLYEFTSAHETAGEWDSTEVTEKTVADEIGTVKSGLISILSTEVSFTVDASSMTPIAQTLTIPYAKIIAVTQKYNADAYNLFTDNIDGYRIMISDNNGAGEVVLFGPVGGWSGLTAQRTIVVNVAYIQ